MENLPLKGIRVLDATHFMQGPLASQLLADLGAEVIRLEAPEGCVMRGQGIVLFGQNLNLPDNRAMIFEISNRNKKGVSLDLRKPGAKEVVYRLAETCDVFVTNLTADSLCRFGIEEEAIRRHNPGIIYVQGTAFGSKGPEGSYPGNDPTCVSRSGFMLSWLKGDEPIWPPHAISDVSSATTLAFGAITALLARQRLGIVQSVEASQLGGMMWLQQLAISLCANIGGEFLKYDRRHGTDPLQNVYQCGDGKWIAIGLGRGDRDWVQLCGIMALDRYIGDPRFTTSDARLANGDELIVILDEAFTTKTREEWDGALRTTGLGFSIVNTVPDLFTDPQVIANEYLGDFASGFKLVNFPFQLGDSVVMPKGDSPTIGRDTMDILTSLCGYSWEEAADLVSAGVV
ncbi:MAG: CoA transferase [Dehalococcoidia bacterium]|nr:CoA transferase [Dehalococcoidia bacterium]